MRIPVKRRTPGNFDHPRDSLPEASLKGSAQEIGHSGPYGAIPDEPNLIRLHIGANRYGLPADEDGVILARIAGQGYRRDPRAAAGANSTGIEAHILVLADELEDRREEGLANVFQALPGDPDAI